MRPDPGWSEGSDATAGCSIRQKPDACPLLPIHCELHLGYPVPLRRLVRQHGAASAVAQDGWGYPSLQMLPRICNESRLCQRLCCASAILITAHCAVAVGDQFAGMESVRPSVQRRSSPVIDISIRSCRAQLGLACGLPVGGISEWMRRDGGINLERGRLRLNQRPRRTLGLTPPRIE